MATLSDYMQGYNNGYSDGLKAAKEKAATSDAPSADAVDAQRYRQLKKSGAIIAWAHVGPWVYGEAVDAEMDKWIAGSEPKGDGND